MNVDVKQILFLLFLCFAFASCESEYSRTVKRELKSGMVHEDLIFGMKIGQTQKDFYDQCWQLNKQALISQGPGNRFAKYTAPLDSMTQDSNKVDMLFYGIFNEDKVMYGMHMIFSYLRWSPWNERYQSDSLMADLEKKYMKDFPGNPFLEIQIKDDVKAFAKVDGNRRILMYPTSPKDVTVKIVDLRQEDLLNE